MPTAPAPAPNTRLQQALVALIGVFFAPAALQAAFFPRSFFDDFPMGRGWIVGTEPFYGEHLVRDVGALFLALVIVSIWAWWEPALCLPLGVAWLVQGMLHVIYHAGHLDDLDGVDAVGMFASLLLVPALAIVVIVAELRDRRSRLSAAA